MNTLKWIICGILLVGRIRIVNEKEREEWKKIWTDYETARLKAAVEHGVLMREIRFPK